MKSKSIIFIVTILSIIFISTYSFADNNIFQDATDGVRNFVGGAENAVENTVNGVAAGIKDGVASMQNNNQDNNNDNMSDGYTASRTSLTYNTNNTFLGMGPTAWTWFILAVLGIITVALVWYYGQQKEASTHNHDDNY